MTTPERPSAKRVLLNALRLRCPACSEGRVFPDGYPNARICEACGWQLERCEGHWVGGNEINMLVTFPTGVAVFGGISLLFGFNPWTAAIGAVCTAAFSLWIHRRCRAVFFALDYLIDPVPDDADIDRDPLLEDSPLTPAPTDSGRGLSALPPCRPIRGASRRRPVTMPSGHPD